MVDLSTLIVNLPDILSNGYNGNSYHIGCGFVVLAIGIVIAVAGCFIDIVKPFQERSSC